jgi:electron transport complex protein RnfB
MTWKLTRRELLEHAARGGALVGLGGLGAVLGGRAIAQGAWQLDPSRCINSAEGDFSGVCELCANQCVLGLSAVRAVNDYAACGRCYICPGYFDVQSAVGPDGLPSRKLCPRDAIKRTPIGEFDPRDPANSYYEYVIDETRCNGCGRCVLGCKMPAGLGSIKLEVRRNLCVDCNWCSIALACPPSAYGRQPPTATGRELPTATGKKT